MKIKFINIRVKMTSILVLATMLLTFRATQAEVSQEVIEKYRKRQEALTAANVLDLLKEGNARFAEGKSLHGFYPIDARERREVSALSQRPLATVLSCIDSRTSPEVIFDTTVGDLFTARVGANVLNDDILGSLEITAESGSKVLIVLGHTDCGGIKAACNNLELGHFTQLLDRIKPAIAKAHAALDADPQLASLVGERVTTNRHYTAHIAHYNVEQTTKQILDRSPLIREKLRSGELTLLPAIYDVDTGRVKFNTLVD